MELRYKINSRILLVAMIGAIMVCASYLMFVYNPLAMIIKKILAFAPGSLLYNFWTDPPYEVYIKAKIFNVTNPDEFLRGEAPMNLAELGPYVYKENLHNINSEFNDNGTITFKQKRIIKFVPELSSGDPRIDRLISPNIPLLGIASTLHQHSMFINMAVASVSQYLGSKPFVNVSIEEYLWGYDDPLVQMANNILPQWIDFPRFGILDRMMSLDNASNTILMNIKPDSDEIYTVEKYNGSPGLHHWGYVDTEDNSTVESNTVCNTVRGTYESGLYPPNVNKPNSNFRMYRRAFCRPVKFAYDGNATTGHFEGYQYRVSNDFLATPEENPDNSCYCVDGDCPLKGMAHLSPCYYGIPVTISQPHFYNSDPRLHEHVTGLNPEREKHDSTLILHKEMGVPLKANLKIQINLAVPETKYNTKTKPFNGIVIPLFWLELNIEDVPFTVKLCVVAFYEILPIVQQILIYVCCLAGLAMVSGSALALLFTFRTSSNTSYSPVPIIPMATQYFKPEISIRK